MYLLDTDTLACFFRGRGRVGARLLATPPAQVVLPAIVVAEVEWGIARAQDPAARLAQWQAMLAVVKVVPFGTEEAALAAQVQVALQKTGAPLAPLDTLVAATALAHNAVLVTRATHEFARVSGLRCQDWY